MKQKRGGLLLIALLAPFCSYASQKAEVVESTVEVYEHPSRSSAPVGTLAKGTLLNSSSRMVKDSEGNYWYKVQVSPKVFGYVSAHGVKTSQIVRDLKSAGISEVHEKVEDYGPGPWNVLVRAMGFGGADALAAQWVYGGEGELSFNLPLSPHGYLHRMLGLGAAFLYQPREPVLLGSVIFRVYEDSRLEPEVRLRFGDGLVTNSWQGGLNIGINYPFSLAPGAHVAFYAELGSLADLSLKFAQVWLACGLGFHF